jgi:hypothetical protein
VAERDFFKNLAKSRGGGVVKILEIAYLHRTSSSVMQSSHNTAHAYNKGYAIKIARNVMQRSTSYGSTQAPVNISTLANVRACIAIQSLLPSSLNYGVFLLIGPAQTNG